MNKGKVDPKHYCKWDVQANRFPYYLTLRPVTDVSDPPGPLGRAHGQTQTKEDQASGGHVSEAGKHLSELRKARRALRSTMLR